MLSLLHKVEIIKIKIFISCEVGEICYANRVHHSDGINCDVRCVCSTVSRKHASVTKVFFPVSPTNTNMKSHINHQHVCITSERLERVFRMYHVQAYSVKSVLVDSCKSVLFCGHQSIARTYSLRNFPYETCGQNDKQCQDHHLQMFETVSNTTDVHTCVGQCDIFFFNRNVKILLKLM